MADLYEGYGTGCLPLSVDARDYPMLTLPGAAESLAGGLPASLDLTLDFRRIYDQGQEASCVAFSTCGLTSAFDWLVDKGWDDLDGHRLYRALGGTGSNGVDTRATLAYAQGQGVPLLSGIGSIKIGSYVFATRSPGVFRQEIAAALASGHLCTLALLLPTPFGWDSGTSPTSIYHQVVCCGYTGLGDTDQAIIVNSWGPSWGRAGFGRVRWSYIEGSNLQNGYAYAYAVSPLVLPKPLPEPLPEPLPTPTKVSITGYGRVTETTPTLRPRQPFEVRGTGLADPAVSFTLAGLPVPFFGNQRADNTVATFLAPDTKVPVLGPVAALRGGAAVATGPLVVVAPNIGPTPTPNPPPPPSALTVTATYIPGHSTVYAFAMAGDRYVAANVSPVVSGGSLTLQTFHSRCTEAGVPATFSTRGRGTVVFTATADDGRQGTATLTI